MSQPSRIIDHRDSRSFYGIAVELRLSGRSPFGTYELPKAVAAAVDRNDPDQDLILEALYVMGWVGFDMAEAQTLELATKAARNKAARIARELANGSFGREVDPTLPKLPPRVAEVVQPRAEEACVVYYMRIGNRVKIGFSGNVKGRASTIGPEEVLVTEQGGPKLEARRHLQFAELRTHGEWFRYEGPLVEHVAELRRAVA